MGNFHTHIFLADDDEDDRGFFQEAIVKISPDCILTMVDNGEKAINYFLSDMDMPDFIFLDINMPVRNGLECLKFIKEKYPENNFHVIILSTSIAEEDINFSYKHGASAYIQKPGSFLELVKVLDYCLHHLSHEPKRNEFILNHKFSPKRMY